MTTAIIIISILFFLYLIFKKNTAKNSFSRNENTVDKNLNEIVYTNGEYEDNIFIDENGLEYRLVGKTREIPRQTFIKANLNGKYWGELDENISYQFSNSKFYDFNIYEVTLNNSEYSKVPFKIEVDYKIPREKLPKLLNTILQKDGKEYEVNLYEPIFELGSLKFNRKLHQDEGNEVFGTIDGIVTGYILDFINEYYTEKEYTKPFIETSTPTTNIEEPILKKTFTPTGNVEYNGNYKRIERLYSDGKTPYWDNWEYIKSSYPSNNEGCFSSIIRLIGTIVGFAFLLIILPSLLYILPFFLILLLLNIIPAKIYSLIFKIIGIIILIAFLWSLFQFFNESTNTFIPKPTIIENPKENELQTTPILDTINDKLKNDTLIKHYRIWKDYEGNSYEGYIWTKKSDYNNSKYFKRNLKLAQNTQRDYDEMLYLLKENDKQKLIGIFQLFDSIRANNQLTSIKFAELIVSFVQDIPYALILPDDCNPNLYNDKFIKEYLNTENARCDGFEKFGINSPLEFMSNLNGDCDTRSLLLYTILAHYGFDVALFSSEFYSHSIIGVNLPFNGIAYKHGNQRYVLWETTAANIRAGILPKEISNINYWRISLKSK